MKIKKSLVFNIGDPDRIIELSGKLTVNDFPKLIITVILVKIVSLMLITILMMGIYFIKIQLYLPSRIKAIMLIVAIL